LAAPTTTRSLHQATPRAWTDEEWQDIEDIVTEDDTPVESLFHERQRRLLIEPLYDAWPGPGEGRPFVAMADVGVFYARHEPPLVPDALLSLDVRLPDDPFPKANRSYFLFKYGKPPDVVVEVVSNRKGGEGGRKRKLYARIGVPNYVIFDPEQRLGAEVLRVFELREGRYERLEPPYIEAVGLGLRLWSGVFEEMAATWLRWCDRERRVLPTGAELVATARSEAAWERARAEEAHLRADRLAAKLRALGIEPDPEG
jgi:Uma2 family endonuclease